MQKKQLIIGTRGSKLAIWQAEYVAGRLSRLYPEITIEIRKITTTGDKILDVPLAKIGGKGLFTKEIDRAMLKGEIDIAVHSLKDMPTELPEGLTLAAVTEREQPGDAFISKTYRDLASLPRKATIGTSSLRRKAQLLCYRPDLHIVDLRGNIDTRLKKLVTEQFDGIILAAVGLKRLGLEKEITQLIPFDIMLPAVGQGALAIQARAADTTVLKLLAALDDYSTRQTTYAEREFLRIIEGGCQVPVGVYGHIDETGLVLEAVIASTDGKQKIRRKLSGRLEQPEKLGALLAHEMLIAGGREILQTVMRGE